MRRDEAGRQALELRAALAPPTLLGHDLGMSEIRQRALELLGAVGFANSSAEAALEALERGGLRLADATHGEFVCRWVNAAERAVPATADTIIRTVTRTHGAHSESRTHWLEGIVDPPFPP